MFNQKTVLTFVISTALLGGFGAFFIYNLIFDNFVLSIIIGATVTIFIAGMGILFMANMIDTIKYQFLLTRTIQSLEKRRRYGRLKSFIQKLKIVRFR